jgi:hypothetical protein
LIFIVLLLLAAVLRLGALGRLPLNAAEATLSLQAADSTLQASPFWESHAGERVVSPLHRASTALIFSFVNATNASARIMPALAGIGLVCIPYLLLRRRLGALASLCMTAFLALSPILIAVSRTADGTSFALLGFGIGLGFLWREHRSSDAPLAVGAAIGFGLVLASGPAALDGLSTLTVGCLILLMLRLTNIDNMFAYIRNRWTRMHTIVAAVTVLLLAGGLGFSLENISTLAESLSVWFFGWRHSSGIHPLTALYMLIGYAPMTVVFGAVSAVRALREKEMSGVVATAWALGGLLLVLLYPDRAGRHLVWVVLPLAFLAASTAVGLIERLFEEQNTLEFFAVCTALLVMFAFAYLQIAAYAAGVGPLIDPLNANLRLLMGGGVLLITALVVVFFGLGWSWRLAFDALGMAGGVSLLAMSVMAVWRLNFSASAFGASELWRPRAPTRNLRVMVHTIETLSHTHTGRVDALPVRVVGTAPPELAWALRPFPQADPGLGLNEESVPAYIFNDADDPPALTADYTGQGFATTEAWSWRGALPPAPIRWWVRRELPTAGEQWVLLIRLDIATLGERQVDEAESP